MMKRQKYRMAKILNCRATFSQIWKQQKAEAKAFGSRSLKLQSIDGLFESTKLKKLKEVCTKKIFQLYNV